QPGQGNRVEQVNYEQTAELVRKVHAQDIQRSRSWRNNILWVDDRPENNVFVRQAFEGIGLSITLALSTTQALEILDNNKFSAIISDMGRKEGPREGYVLLDKLRNSGDQTPFFIYAG